MPSAMKYPQVIWEKIMKEVVAQRVCGPFEKPPFKNYFCSPLGLVPKAGQLGAFRMIFNLSAGQPESINGSTPDCFKTTRYNDFDKAIALVASLGAATRVGKADLAAAFRQTPINPLDWSLLVFKATHPITRKLWYFFDNCLPFGSGESCQIYQRISNALAFAVSKLTGKPLVNYIDDFFFADKGTEVCNNQIELFLDVTADISFPVSPDKMEWAAEWVTFLGLLIHGKLQLIGLPQEKLDKAEKMIQNFLAKRGARVKQYLSLAGYLNFLTRALNYGRLYLRRIYDTIQPVHTHLQWHVKIPAEVKQDLLMWKGFLSTKPFYKQFIDHLEQSVSEVSWFTDASGHPRLGLGCFLNGQWFQARWPSGFVTEETSTCYLELVAVALSIAKWAHLFENKRIRIHCDNRATVSVVNNLTLKCGNCMCLVRLITLVLMRHNARFRLQYMHTKENRIADSLSCFQERRFHELAPSAALHPVSLPEGLWPLPESWSWRSRSKESLQKHKTHMSEHTWPLWIISEL